MSGPLTLAFVDLDDTVLSSLRKLGPGDHTPVALSATDGWQGYQNAAQRRLLRHLLAHADVIPTTGRSRTAFDRVQLTWWSWAILDHGATILRPGGELDPTWTAQVEKILSRSDAALRGLTERLATHLRGTQPELSVRIHDLGGHAIYAVVKHPGRQPGALRAAAAYLQALTEGHADWSVFANDSTLTLMPAAVSKAAAVTYVREQLDPHGQALTVGVGDTLSDLPFMALCDYALTPGRSQVMTAAATLHPVNHP
ncbi:hypothetical protein [Deinococcus soli (ex Cha et al. 2016)]|uniref:Trehalose-6-phosphatase n=2 Tax=Deinococcus soli (ex Cha et al. 2016) TaxID=1309411 RepID=A0ACC6KFN4_9DEIO|nr:hypothetical protein [Deinococcus soli (ex Cha et al. 2016)]MDR6218370.1 trehalose-6-phosphatase [Deinococcus soli (ex Cha et al. 2016)]MDR6329110.1 trehalose-6-phosphatase [Deinococcus soli (ex Cha et al. 2016)]MDR6751383.1 trehalose-6-phosphatase [Deinococcus soli (ex Cha et al. 2016)]